MSAQRVRIPLGLWASLAALLVGEIGDATAQERPAIEDLEFAELEFLPSESVRHTLEPGVDVFVLEDRSLPLVSVYARLRGGPRHFARTELAAATALPIILRSGGTVDLSPDSVNALLEFYAAQTTFGGGGGTSFSRVNVLTRHLDEVLPVWGDLLARPAFDTTFVEVWRGRQLEDVRRKRDTPGRLAVSTFNRLLFGDHPVGWELGEADLERENLTQERLTAIHAKVFCLDNLTLGVSGDVTWGEIRPKLEQMLAGWSPCDSPLQEPSPSDHVVEPGVYLLPRKLEQSTVVIGKPSAIRLADDRDYFASRIGNAILGGSGLASRLATRVRTEEGLAYSVASVWTAPRRSIGIVGAITQTKSESTVATTRLILEVLSQMSTDPASDSETHDAIDRIVNGFVFNFQSPGQIVSRQMLYVAQELPADWLERYLAGIQAVSAADVERVFRTNLSPEGMDDMVILVVGDPDRFDDGLEEFGTIRVVEPEEPLRRGGDARPRGTALRRGRRGGLRRSRRSAGSTPRPRIPTPRAGPRAPRVRETPSPTPASSCRPRGGRRRFAPRREGPCESTGGRGGGGADSAGR